MQKLSIVMCMMWIIIPLSIIAQKREPIHFEEQGNWSEILTKAKKENKFIFVDVYTTWCGPCKSMDNSTYPISGAVMNPKFISIKVQMDSTFNDNPYIRSWYAEAKQMRIRERINAYPSLLFYTPDGKLIHKAIGYKTSADFTTIAKFVSDTNYVNQFNMELAAYKAGKRDYATMIKLHNVVKQVMADKALAMDIAKTYQTGYLDKADLASFRKDENIQLIRGYNLELTKLDDRFFQMAYNDPEAFDSIVGKGNAKGYIFSLIGRDLIGPKLYLKDKPITQKPNWKALHQLIAKKYPKANVDEIILGEQIGFYRRIENWDLCSYYKSEHVKKFPPKSEGLAVFTQLNMPAWDVFLHSDNKKALERALNWVDLAIKLEHSLQYLDTRANILYKLGRVDEAISQQEKAVILDHEDAKKSGKEFILADYRTNLDKMKKGEPTWDTKQ